MKRVLMAALAMVAATSCRAERICVTPDCLHVEARGQTALSLRIWVPKATASFALGVYDQTDDAPTAKPSSFTLKAPDGSLALKLEQAKAGAWSDYTVETGGRWGVWNLAVAGPTAPPAAEGKAAPNPRNAFMARTSGEVDLYLQPESTPRKLVLSPPKFGTEGPHRLWVQLPATSQARLTTSRPADPASTVMSLALPAHLGAKTAWEGMARGGVESLVVKGDKLAGVWPLTVDKVTAAYRLGAAGNLRLFCTATPLMASARQLALRTTAAGQPAPARVAFSAVEAGVDTLTLFTNTRGEGVAQLLPGVAYRVVASHGMEYGSTEQALPADATELRLDVPRLSVRPAGWVCGDSHSHSVYSDGADTPQQMVEAARAEGLDFHFLSDHGTGTDLPHMAQAHAEIAPLSEAGRFLALPATEYTLRDYHANVLGELFSFPADRPLQEMLDHATARNTADHPVAVHLNHPTWTGTPKAPALARELQRLPMIELFNGPEPGGIELWWELLNRDMKVAAATNTDSHSRVGSPLGARRTFVWLGDKPLTMANVLAAMREGRAYLSTGAVLEPAINGARPGDTVAGGKLTATFSVQSATPVDSVDLVVNGKVAATLAGEGRAKFQGTLSAEAASGWAVLRVLAKGNPTPLALTNPVYLRAGN